MASTASTAFLHDTGRLTIDGVAEIAGAFNAAQLFFGTRIDQDRANSIFGAWWEGAVNLSGLEISSPALNEMKGAYERLDPPGRGSAAQPELNYRYPTVPLPQDAGAPHGIAPVFAGSVTWDRPVLDRRQESLDVAGAMHAANEMIWFHGDELNGFLSVNF